MSDFTADLKVINDLYRKEKRTINVKEKVNKHAFTHFDPDEQNAFMEGFTNASYILESREAFMQGTGADRDTAEVAEGMEIFPKLEDMLKESGRSGESKYMAPIIRALHKYMNSEGIQIETAPLKAAKTAEDEAARPELKKAAEDNAFKEFCVKTVDLMNDFVTACDNYIKNRTGKTKSWTAHGKQRRALIRAAKFQMEDQIKHFNSEKETQRDNIVGALNQAAEGNEETLKLSAHDTVSSMFMEVLTKKEKAELNNQVQEIVNRIVMDDKIQKNGENIRQTNVLGSLLNMGRTKDELKEFNLSALYSEYQKIRKDRKTFDHLCSSKETLKAMFGHTIKDVRDESAELKAQKAKISAVFYLMTGKHDDVVSFCYLWDYDEKNPGFAEFIKAYPTSIPTFSKEGNSTGKEFLEYAEAQFGAGCLKDLNYLKYTNGEATAHADLAKEDAQLWKDLGHSLAQKPSKEELTEEEISNANIIKARYLGLQQALGETVPVEEQQDDDQDEHVINPT